MIGADATRTLLDAARELYFPERTYDEVVEAAEGKADPDDLARFAAFAAEHAVDQKREDALLALERIRDLAEVLP